MKYNYEFDMKYTDNPYIDIIVQCVKILGMNAVVKNENQALHYEDVRSARNSAKLIKLKEGYWDEKKDGPFNEWNYMEWNSYYRMLNGEPPAYSFEDEMAYVEMIGERNDIYEDIGNALVIPELYKRYFIDMSQYTVPESMPTLKLEGKYLHELSLEELSMIESCGIMKQIFADYSEDPHYQYIYHLGDKRVDYYTARKAANFSLLWVPELNTFDIIENKFKRVFDRNRKYTMSTVYSEAYRFMSYHYDSFIEILIIIQTMVDMISEVQEYIINKDVFDSRTIRYLFESYGIAYYKEIPTKYQIRIIKNVNTLLKYKSSHRNIIDILELFDDDTIKVYTYYLMKTKKLSRDDFFYYTADDVNPKYNTNRDYWLGNPSDISNNKIPLTSVIYNEDETDFIKSHIYDYKLEDDETEDNSKNRILTEYQPVANMISKPLESLTNIEPANSFIDTFLRNGTVNWFGRLRYNEDIEQGDQSIKFLVLRNSYLTNFRNAIAERIKKYFDVLCRSVKDLALNKYYYRRLKYELYGALGVFDTDICYSDSFNTMTDLELENYFYQADTLITESYRAKHGLMKLDINGEYEEFGTNSEDRFILNHSIPYMTYFEYKGTGSPNENLEDIENHFDVYVFRNNNSFSVFPAEFPDEYDRWTKLFRETYLIAVRSYVEGIFNDLEVDSVNNPTPQYVGWMDLNYVLGQTGKTISELKIGDMVTTKGNPNIPIYTSAYVYEVITEEMIGQEFFRKNYDLCFLKVPILDPNAFKVLERFDMRRSYDSITLADPFWDGVSTFDLLTEEERSKLHQSKKQDILSKDFTIERTKYIAVEASIDLTKMSYQVSYFMNMLYDRHLDEEQLLVDVDKELVNSGKAKLSDLLSFAIALNYLYQGVEPDNIASDMEKNMYINGFNFDTDWIDIYNYLQNQHHIYNNYLNDLHKYSYTDEFGEEHKVIDGFGMEPLNKGYMSELYEDFHVYKNENPKIQTYLGKPIYKNENGEYIHYDPESDTSKLVGEPVNQREVIDSTTKMPSDTRVGAFLSGRYKKCEDDCITTAKYELDFGYSDIWNYNLKNAVKYDWYTGNLSTIDISWSPTQYPNIDNNSHGLWLDTAILPVLDNNKSDLERINMLKKIYYSNTNLYNHLVYMMKHAESKRMYDIYKVVFDSFMQTKMNHDFYKIVDNDGNPVYSDGISTSSSYHIEQYRLFTIDEEGFPIYHGRQYDTKNNTVSEQNFYFEHNDDFTECFYIGEDDGHKIECLYNERKYREEGIKDYYLTTDFEEQFKYGRFILMEEGYEYSLSEVTRSYLVNINNKDIKIPITMDDKGNISYIEGTTDNITVEIIRDSNGEPTGEIRITIKNEDDTIEELIRPEWKVASDYYEFLQYRNPELYSKLIDIKYNYDNVYDPVSESYKPSDDKRQRIEYLCELIVIALEKYFDKNEWKFLFNLIPTANIQNIQNYIMKVVVFFKSWKTQILDTAVTYVLDDSYGNYVQILDDMYYNVNLKLMEKLRPKDYKYFENHTQYRDPVEVREKVKLDKTSFDLYWVTIGFGEKLYGHKFDYPNFTSKVSYRDKVGPREKVEIKVVDYNGDVKQDNNGNYSFP